MRSRVFGILKQPFAFLKAKNAKYPLFIL